MSEPQDIRRRRLTMRSHRRGMKEMDIVLGAYADGRLPDLGAEELDLYEALLSEADQDLWSWIGGARPAPARFSALIAEIRGFAADHAGKPGRT